MEELHETNGESVFNRGKVRDIYTMDEDHLIIITTDRMSVFDQVFPNPIPGKGVYLNRLTNFWFDFLKIKDHRVSLSEVPEKELDDFLGMESEVQDRMMVVRKAEPFPVAILIRRYLVGTAWVQYDREGCVCGQLLPAGLKEGDLIPDGPVLTPVEKKGSVEMSLGDAARIVGAPWEIVVDMALDIFNRASKFVFTKGLLLVDTRLEFGMVDGEVTLIDDVLTPDSSRYWGQAYHASAAGRQNPLNYDKQFIKDWLLSTKWMACDDLPEIPIEVVTELQSRYKSLTTILTT